MRKVIQYALILSACLLAGCSDGSAADKTPNMTQPIITDMLGSEKESTAASPGSENIPKPSQIEETQSTSSKALSDETDPSQNAGAPANAGAAQSGDSTAAAWNYCLAKAEKDAVEIEIENLESAFRVGSIDEAAFRSGKSALDTQKEELEQKEDTLKRDLKPAYEKPPLPTGTTDQLLARLLEAEQQEDNLENEEERLEDDYRLGNLTREDYINKQAELIQRDELLDQEKELLEDALEALGWDD